MASKSGAQLKIVKSEKSTRKAPPAKKPVRRATPKPAHKTTKAPAVLGVVGQVRLAFKAKHRLATLCGFLLGGFVPMATFMVGHYEYNRAEPFWAQIATVLIIGGLAYSAKTVFDWAKMAFGIPFKAAGFVVLIEGVMTFSTNHWLSFAALAYLVVINGIATGVRLAVAGK